MLSLQGRVVGGIISTIVKHPLSPKLMLAESAVYNKCGDDGGGMVGRSSGPAHRRTPGVPREPPGSCSLVFSWALKNW